MNCGLDPWQDVFIILGILALFVVPILALHVREQDREIAHLRAVLRGEA